MCRILAGVAISVFALSLLAGEKESPENQPAQNEEPARKTQSSDKAVVKDVVYGLEEQDEHLFLTSQPLDGVDRQLKRVEVKFPIPQGARITELSLAKLDGKNLMAVVKVARGDEYDFHCLTFIAPSGGHVRERHGLFRAKFFTTQADLKILAVGGRHFGGSVFIVLGDIAPDNQDVFESVTEGVFYFTNCPWPPSDGQLSPFRIVSVPQKGEAE